jgi:hypothetical protein
MANKDELHKLIDELPEGLTAEVLDFVQFLRLKENRRSRDAALMALRSTPLDDEPYTDEERSEAAEAWEEYKREGGISAEEARRRLL